MECVVGGRPKQNTYGVLILGAAHNLKCGGEGWVGRLKVSAQFTCGAHPYTCATANIFICGAHSSAPQVKCYLWRTRFVVRHRYSLTRNVEKWQIWGNLPVAHTIGCAPLLTYLSVAPIVVRHR